MYRSFIASDQPNPSPGKPERPLKLCDLRPRGPGTRVDPDLPVPVDRRVAARRRVLADGERVAGDGDAPAELHVLAVAGIGAVDLGLLRPNAPAPGEHVDCA